MLFSKTPAWVKNLPDNDLTKGLLVQLVNSSKKPLDTPREINFDIRDFANKDEAEAAALQ
jgi:hypothetical protein